MILSEGLYQLIEGIERAKKGVVWDYRCRPMYDDVITQYRKQAVRLGRLSSVGDEAFSLFEPIQGFVGVMSINSPTISVGYYLGNECLPEKICKLNEKEYSLVNRASQGFIDEITLPTFFKVGIKQINVETQFLISLRNLIKAKLDIQVYPR